MMTAVLPRQTSRPGARCETPTMEQVGRRVSVYWDGDAEWFDGNIVKYRTKDGKHQVRFDDGDLEWYDLAHEALKKMIRFNDAQPSSSSAGPSLPSPSPRKRAVTSKDSAPKKARPNEDDGYTYETIRVVPKAHPDRKDGDYTFKFGFLLGETKIEGCPLVNVAEVTFANVLDDAVLKPKRLVLSIDGQPCNAGLDAARQVSDACAQETPRVQIVSNSSDLTSAASPVAVPAQGKGSRRAHHA